LGDQYSQRGVKFWISAWLPVLIGILAITQESTATFGSDRTDHPLRFLFQLIVGPLSDSTWELIHVILRKSGHFAGYGLISLTWLRAWRKTLPNCRFVTAALLALLGTAALASWDEWHQSFFPNRGSSPWDVLLDCCGATVMLLLAGLYVRFYKRLGFSMSDSKAH